MRKKIALLVGQPEEHCQNLFIQDFLEQAFSDDYDVCIFAMYQKHQVTKIREHGESNIFSLVEYDLFDTIVILANTIQTPGVLDRIEEELREHDQKPVIFADKESKPFIGRSCGGSPEKKTAAIAEGTPSESQTLTDEFDFNISTMDDDMLMQTDLSGVVNTIFSYVDRIRPFDSFHLCLNKYLTEENSPEESSAFATYSDHMLNVLRCGAPGQGTSQVSLTAEFDRKKLLPELSEECDKPRAYYFTPLFFEEHCFGYAAINYGETIRCYDASYKRWLSVVMRGLEAFWRVQSLNIKNSQMEINQIRDALTGLYNYKGFLNAVTAALGEMSDGRGFVSIAAIELCGLNELYMNLGNHDGDKVILDFSQILFGITGKDLLCHLGNGEFLVGMISLEEKEDGMYSIAEKTRQKLMDYSHSNGLDGKLGIAFGEMQGQAATEEKLGNLIGEAVSIKNADKIKQQRQGHDNLTDDEKKKLKLVSDILDHNRLIYFFQPIVDANSGEIFAYEALMRADTEEFISPLDILKYAEHLGRLCDVEKATFSNVLAYINAHKEKFENKKIFINSIPGAQIPEENAVPIRENLKKISGQVVIELTEQAELNDAELESLKEKYKKLGVDTAVDDYGTGYSNVYNLLRYMPNFVKIDRMLLANIQLSAQKQHFVKEIIEFAHNNQITVLAEGVETPEELNMVTSLGVDLIQGYYTAKPKAEVISKIDYKIQNEIVQYGQYALQKNKRKIYTAGHIESISLVKLAAGHYSKIQFTRDAVPYKDVAIVGLQGFLANMEIEIEDSYSGRIELKDIDLAVHNEQPAIRLGENCDVTLVLSGDNILERGGILVPESSKLTVQGDGNLLIKQIAVDGYGIGNDKDGKHGSLCFDQDGLIEIRGNTMHGVGIGAGYGGNIQINRGRYSIQLAGEEAVGIGALYSDLNLSIQYCAIDIDMRNSVNVGIGSLKGNVALDVFSASIRGLFNAHKCTCIGTLEGKSLKFNLADATVDILARAEYLCGIGCIWGDTSISLTRFSLKITTEGKNAFAMGNQHKTAGIHTQNGELIVQVKNNMGFDIGAETFEIINGYSEFMLNGTEIVRESLAGDM